MKTRTGNKVNRSRVVRVRVCELPRFGAPAVQAGRAVPRQQAHRRSAGASGPTGVPAGVPRSGPPVNVLTGRVTRLRPQPDSAYVGSGLPIAVGFGSVHEAAPRTLWVVPRRPAEAVALPNLLDDGSGLFDDGLGPYEDGSSLLEDGPSLLEDGPSLLEDGIVTPLRVPPPVTTPAAGRHTGNTGNTGNQQSRQRAGVEAQPGALRLTARGRMALLVVAGLIGATVVVFAWFGAGAGSAGPTTSAPARVVVHDGDTLWSIAGRVAPRRDPRAVVDELRRLNHLGSPNLVPGQVLRTH